MSNRLNLIGRRFGKLTVIEFAGVKNQRTMWRCLCDCGNYKTVQGKLLKNENVKSCGCLHHTINGLYKHRLYSIIKSMKNRCYNNKHEAYSRYGGRGIKVCDEWLQDFMNFYNWAINNGYHDNLTIDRIDNNKGYSPDNCRFVDRKTQQQNRRTNKFYTINGETHCLKEWCDLLGLNYQKVYKRIRRKWSIIKALELEEK